MLGWEYTEYTEAIIPEIRRQPDLAGRRLGRGSLCNRVSDSDRQILDTSELRMIMNHREADDVQERHTGRCLIGLSLALTQQRTLPESASPHPVVTAGVGLQHVSVVLANLARADGSPRTGPHRKEFDYGAA